MHIVAGSTVEVFMHCTMRAGDVSDVGIAGGVGSAVSNE